MRHIRDGEEILCGMSYTQGNHLSIGNTWVWFHAWKEATCPECIKKAKKIESEIKKKREKKKLS